MDELTAKIQRLEAVVAKLEAIVDAQNKPWRILFSLGSCIVGSCLGYFVCRIWSWRSTARKVAEQTTSLAMSVQTAIDGTAASAMKQTVLPEMVPEVCFWFEAVEDADVLAELPARCKFEVRAVGSPLPMAKNVIYFFIFFVGERLESRLEERAQNLLKLSGGNCVWILASRKAMNQTTLSSVHLPSSGLRECRSVSDILILHWTYEIDRTHKKRLVNVDSALNDIQKCQLNFF